jgi:hypothetical protein
VPVAIEEYPVAHSENHERDDLGHGYLDPPSLKTDFQPNDMS